MATRRRRTIMEESEISESPLTADECAPAEETSAVAIPDPIEEEKTFDPEEAVPSRVNLEPEEAVSEGETSDSVTQDKPARVRPGPIPKRRPRRNSPRFSPRL